MLPVFVEAGQAEMNRRIVCSCFCRTALGEWFLTHPAPVFSNSLIALYNYPSKSAGI